MLFVLSLSPNSFSIFLRNIKRKVRKNDIPKLFEPQLDKSQFLVDASGFHMANLWFLLLPRFCAPVYLNSISV